MGVSHLSIASKRIQIDLKELQRNPLNSCSAGPVDQDMFLWNAAIVGPDDSPFAGGLFFASIQFPRDYPCKPPKISFKTKVYHPSIKDRNGSVCPNFEHNWSPVLTVSEVLLSIACLLADPNPDEPLEPKIARMYKTNRAKYETTARSWTRMYAIM